MPALSTCRLLITYPAPDSRDGLELPLVVASNSSPVKTSRFEPAGLSFHAVALRLLGIDEDEEVEEDGSSAIKEESVYTSSDSFHFKKGKKKSSNGQEEQDHYALLGLGHLRYLATEDQIRKCYREAALKFHPDKQAALILAEETDEAKEAKKEDIDQHFKTVQKAYEVLIDPVKRRIFDSTDEFDDAVPGDCAPQDFFKVYGPVFMRNARWSVTQPVPSLGTEETPLDEVDKMYDFWNRFKSWREFPDANEYDVEQAESRDHKRWMERQNAKLSEKARKEESARIRLIVENAFKRDPRILKRRDDEKAEKIKKKEAKAQAKREKEEEAARLLEEEKLRKEQEDKRVAEEAAAQKKSKEREKKLLKKEKTRLRTASTNVATAKDSGVSEDDIEQLCSALDINDLRNLSDEIEKKSVKERAQILKVALGRLQDEASHANVEPKKAVEGVEGSKSFSTLHAGEKKEKPWGKEEVELLRKAVQKYPKGTPQRWEVVSSYIGTGRSVEEILKAIKTVLLQKPDSSKAFDSFLEKRKVGNVVIASPLSTREDSVQEQSSSTSSINGEIDNPEIADGSSKLSGINAEENVDKQSSSNGVQPTADGKSIKVDQDVWSDVQEGALVKALKAFPKDTPQRWDRIATAVPGKTKAQCYRKFGELKENFRSRKG